MKNTKVRVYVQYFDENGKMKHSNDFIFRADSDVVGYADPEALKTAIQEMIDKATEGYAGRYEYRGHDMEFFEERELDATNFDNRLRELHQAQAEGV